jgi:hypothetical protein
MGGAAVIAGAAGRDRIDCAVATRSAVLFDSRWFAEASIDFILSTFVAKIDFDLT